MLIIYHCFPEKLKGKYISLNHSLLPLLALSINVLKGI